MPKFPAVKVNCYAGLKGEERPVSFELKNRVIHVKEILDSWHGPDYRYHKIIGDDNHIYILRYDLNNDVWECEYTESKL